MTDEGLLAAGFTPFPPSPQLDKWDTGFQRRIRDEHGTRYFVNVFKWDHTRYGAHVGYEAEITYNDGCDFHKPAAIRVTAYSSVNQWTPEDVLDWAAKLWSRLAPRYYERNDDQ